MADFNSHLTRRRLVQTGAVASALAASTCVRQQAFGQSTDTDPEMDEARLAARSTFANQLTLAVQINETGPYQFVVDTAAEQTVLADDVASRLGLRAGRMVIMRGLSHSVPAQTVNVKKLALGPFTHKDLNLPVLPKTLLGADGYLGLDIISNSRITFDFGKRNIRIERPRFSPQRIYSPRTARIQATGSAGRLRITDCRVDGVIAAAIIDSGAELSMGNIALRNALVARHGHRPDLGPVVLTGVTGGDITGRLMPINRIRMQDLIFSDCAVAIAEISLFESWSLSQKPALLVGMDFLRQFRAVSIDFRAQEIRFELATAPPNPKPVVEIVRA
ncbi:aspartyl protease family protein [Asticcacaulis sp. SL142]|uniref:aspartyl protease family protein n=1 Tax=Asticcacaulis sp. SL142 TaxID=2995155 RepID=UPI00226CB31F|nr:aspartyl protease family protein [Asticcacaulis sp. SL142]WAC47518.1 aspartyl protease family protein [Asticcacaulis sp. SL142]